MKVLVTGSTGFKGSWLSFWLNKLNAKVIGVGLKPEKDNILFSSLKLNKKINQHFIDICDYNKLSSIIQKARPDIIFHLAAQSIVSDSYKDPLHTIKTNTLGSTNLLEIVKKNKLKNLIYITSDKCYLNNGDKFSFNEFDKLGGNDVYSSSKAAAETIFHSYYNSFFKKDSKYLKMATARAGNVIGGGDFKRNRIIPDLFKSIKFKKKLIIRNPNSLRPWQHVLEPLSGYLLLGEKVLSNNLKNNLYPSWNFGPNVKNCKRVIEIIKKFYEYLDIPKKYKILRNNKMNEAKILRLNINKSNQELLWKPKLNLDQCIRLTSNWYINYLINEDVFNITNEQIEFFSEK